MAVHGIADDVQEPSKMQFQNSSGCSFDSMHDAHHSRKAGTITTMLLGSPHACVVENSGRTSGATSGMLRKQKPNNPKYGFLLKCVNAYATEFDEIFRST